jgi:hypothetical protein
MHGLDDIARGLDEDSLKVLKSISACDPHQEGETLAKCDRPCDPDKFYPPEKGGKTRTDKGIQQY